MNSLLPNRPSIFAAIFLTGLAAAPIQAGPKLYSFGTFVPRAPATTLTDWFKTADFVIVTHVVKDRPDQLAVDEILKPHDWLKGKNTISPDNGKTTVSPLIQFVGFGQFAVYGEKVLLVHKGPSFSPDGILKKYLSGVLKLKDAKSEERLRFFLDYLECKDADVSHDAFRELDNVPVKELTALAKTMRPQKLAAWLRDPAVPPDHRTLYAFMLGICGTAEHAGLLRQGAEDALKRKDYDSALPYLIGHVLLQPKEGWAQVRTLLEKESSFKKNDDPLGERIAQIEDETYACYCALHVADFIREERAGLIDAKELNAGLVRQLHNPLRRWFAVECLRKAKCWDRSEKIVVAFRKSKRSNDYGDRLDLTAVLRFCLQSPDPAAVAFVKEKRASDAKLVSEVENQLKSGK